LKTLQNGSLFIDSTETKLVDNWDAVAVVVDDVEGLACSGWSSGQGCSAVVLAHPQVRPETLDEGCFGHQPWPGGCLLCVADEERSFNLIRSYFSF